MQRNPLFVALGAVVLLTSGCTARVEDSRSADAFMQALASHCGQAFAGRVTVNEPASSVPDPFEGKPPVLHVAECTRGGQEVRLPLHVGDDHSRTWVFTRVAQGLRLRHYQWRADGRPDEVSDFGGLSLPPGSARRQAFAVDAPSIAMFRRIGLPASLENHWTVDVQPGQRFSYQLSRPDGRVFRVEFDLRRPVALPPPPWGLPAQAP